jgi:hypothetical protein
LVEGVVRERKLQPIPILASGTFLRGNQLLFMTAFDETALDAFLRARLKPLRLPFPFIQSPFPLGLTPGSGIEISGPFGSAKTQLLLSLTASITLPDSLLDVKVGGNNGGVIYIDMEGHFDVFRFVFHQYYCTLSFRVYFHILWQWAGFRPCWKGIWEIVWLCANAIYLKPTMILPALKLLSNLLYPAFTSFDHATYWKQSQL